MAWSSETSATQLTSITNSQQIFNVTPTLNPGETAHVRVDVNAVGSTDDVLVRVYASLDGTNWDDTPIGTRIVDTATDPNQVSFLVSGVYQFRVAVITLGATDTHTSADMSYRTNGVSL